MATVTATLTVSFGGDAEEAVANALKLEIDDREDGLNGGDTSFRPGDNAFYLMYIAGVNLIQHFTIAGSISGAGAGAREISGDDAQYITFSQSKEGTLSYPTTNLLSQQWLGDVFDLDGNKIPAPGVSLVDNGTKVVVEQRVTGILKLEYNAPYTAYRLSGVPLELDRTLIFAQAST